MVFPKLRAALFVCAALAAPHGGLAAEPKPPPKFDGTALPEPPSQHKAWTAPPTKLPAAMLSAVDLLYQQGMADPRGCEYREIEVVIGSVWGDGGILKVHAWVFPSDVPNARRFAVGWNGLVYPVVSLGAPAGLKADIDAMLSQDRKAQDEWAKHRGETGLSYMRWLGAIPEGPAISETQMCWTKICPLLRLGEVDLAEAYWTQLNGPAQAAAETPNNDEQKELEKGPYLSLCTSGPGWRSTGQSAPTCAATMLSRAKPPPSWPVPKRRSRRPPPTVISSVRWPSTRRAGRFPTCPISVSSPTCPCSWRTKSAA